MGDVEYLSDLRDFYKFRAMMEDKFQNLEKKISRIQERLYWLEEGEQ